MNNASPIDAREPEPDPDPDPENIFRNNRYKYFVCGDTFYSVIALPFSTLVIFIFYDSNFMPFSFSFTSLSRSSSPMFIVHLFAHVNVFIVFLAIAKNYETSDYKMSVTTLN